MMMAARITGRDEDEYKGIAERKCYGGGEGD